MGFTASSPERLLGPEVNQWRLHGLCHKEAAQEDKQAQAPQDVEEDPLAAATQVGGGCKSRFWDTLFPRM
jgi:hypothetical protein